MPIVVVPVLAQLLWALLKVIRPGYAELPIDPYRPFWYRLAILALAALVVFAWYALLRRRLGPAALAIGGLGWLAVLGLVLAAFAPGGSYLTALPALAGALAGIAAVFLRGWWPVVALALGAAVAIIVLLPTVIMFFPALGLNLAASGAFIATLLGLALLPVIDLLHPEAGGQRGMVAARARRLGALPALAAAVAVLACTATGLVVDRFDAAHPAPTHLMYALDTDTNEALWLSAEASPQQWTSQYVFGPAATVTATLPAFGAEKLLAGLAQAATLPAPLLTKVADSTARRPAHGPAAAGAATPGPAGHPARRRRDDGHGGHRRRPARPDGPDRGRPVGVRLRLPRAAGGRRGDHHDGTRHGAAEDPRHGRQRRPLHPPGLQAPPGRRGDHRLTQLRDAGGGAHVHPLRFTGRGGRGPAPARSGSG
nr:hypothetical protein GCM10020092_100770 [Actinoplanes digitatis]